MAIADHYAVPRSQLERGDSEEYGDIRIFSSGGRLGRIRYIAYSMGFAFLFYLVLVVSLGVLPTIAGSSGYTIGALASGVAWLALMVISILLTIQRCHDFNTSGWLSLLALIPTVVVVFWFIPGTRGRNRFGPQPPSNSIWVTIAAVLGLLIPFVFGLVAAIAIPTYQGYVERAQQLQLEQQR